MLRKMFFYALGFMLLSVAAHSQTTQSDTVWSKYIGSEVLQVKFSPDGNSIYVGAAGRKPFVVSTENGELIKEYEQSFSSVTAMDLSKDGKYLAVAGGEGKKASLIDVNTGIILNEYQIPEAISERFGFRVIYSASLSFDLKYFSIVLRGDNIINENEGYVLLWDAMTGKYLKSLNINGAFRVEYSPTEPILAISTGNSILLYKSDLSENIHSFCCHTNRIQDIAFSPDGSLLASGDMDGVLKIWDVKEKKLIREIKDNYEVNSVGFINNDIVVGGCGYFQNRYVKLLNIKSGSFLGQIRTDLQFDLDIYNPSKTCIIATGFDILLFNFSRILSSINEDLKSNILTKPNPTKGISQIQFTLPIAGKTKVSITDTNTKEIIVLYNDYLEQGEHILNWDTSNVTAGTYYCRITGNDLNETLIIVVQR